ncbi:MAG: hypothetical protein Tsb009_36800 [Planctomycetaceae bacterium]
MSLVERDARQELRHVLWACHDYCCQGAHPENQSVICYHWIIDRYEEKFGERFHQSNLDHLAKAGFLKKESSARGGNRRYYTIENPELVEQLLNEWSLI